MKTQIQDYDILLCYRKTLLSNVIRFATRSKYSHVAIAVNIKGKLFIADAQMNGVDLRGYDEWMNKYNYTYDILRNDNLSVQDTAYIWQRICECVGVKGYDFENLIIRQPLKIITRKWKTKSNEKDSMICSEFVGYAKGYSNPEKLSPGDILKIGLKQGETLINI